MEENKKSVLQLVFTLIFWACFLMLPFIFFPFNPEKSAFESPRFVSLFVFSNLYLAAFYYFNSGVLIPKLLARRKPGQYFALVVSLFFLYLITYYNIWKYSRESIEFALKHKGFHRRSFVFNFFSLGPTLLFLVAFTFSSVSKIISRWFYAEKLKEEVSKQQLETELSLLRSQVNPHFLFNTLNSIYSLTLSKNAKAPDAVMKLSKIMRYTLEESQSESVPLTEELAFIESYLELQKIRATEKVHVDYKVEGEYWDAKIPPLLLIPFIENAFKFGVSTRKETNILVHFRVTENQLIFRCENDIVSNISMPEGTGSGIMNVQRRLELLYKKNYQLKITPEENYYKVLLQLELIK